ncbi:DUF2087 domain-containing protein [Alkalicoccus halolimnae]|uniref:DUF2087 domain-containing protein n=1 Tax=Alkalicoccus halolimnae TaxID=1667239 RepID=A0A5C7F134_9BACI|nr:DUF2087 domain-containing protein [Alkalicoccus halolimnae]TXF81436.1 DUF2087 domain-containing protein [Alkalicoccus halolimnae]
MMRELFWNASIEEMAQGYTYEEEKESYVCLVCHSQFAKGEIFTIGNRQFEAEKAAEKHTAAEHGSMLPHLLEMDKKFTGLSDLQKELLYFLGEGKNDKEIVNEMGAGSTSTIRNHRFKFREKEKQAKVFLAAMYLIHARKDEENDFVDFHQGATMVDERYQVTSKEKEKVLAAYFEEERLKSFPSKEKRKIIVLQHLLNHFTPGKIYSEKEVNAVLQGVYDDFATLRRYFIEYGFMERSRDCEEYWIKSS